MDDEGNVPDNELKLICEKFAMNAKQVESLIEFIKVVNGETEADLRISNFDDVTIFF